MYVRFGSRLNMIHDSSQSNSIFCVMERFVTITEVFFACDYSRARMSSSSILSLFLFLHSGLLKDLFLSRTLVQLIRLKGLKFW